MRENTSATNKLESFRVDLSPARVAYLIKSNSKSGFRRAVQEASTRWGGLTEPIIPVHKGVSTLGLWGQVIESSSVDALVNVDADELTAETLARKFKVPLISITHIDEFQISAFSFNPAAISDQRTVPLVIPIRNQALWQIALAGDYSDEFEQTNVNYLTPYRRESFPDAIGRNALVKNTVIDQTMRSFHEISGQLRIFPTLIWVTRNNNLQDCIWFWNSRALFPVDSPKTSALLLPIDDVINWLQFSEFIESALSRNDEIHPNVVINSISVQDEDELDDFATLLGLEKSPTAKQIKLSYNGDPRVPPFSYIKNVDPFPQLLGSRRYGASKSVETNLYDGKGNLKAELPLEIVGSGRTKLLLGGTALNSLPKSPAIAQFVLNGSHWENERLRILTTLSSYYELSVNLPDLRKASELHLQSKVVKYELSDKGKIGDALSNMGGAESLLGDSVLDTVIALTTRRSKSLLGYVKQNLVSEPDKVLEFLSALIRKHESRSVRGKNLPAGNGESPAELLATIGWADRGVEISCSRCGRLSFITLDQVRSVPLCPGCKSPGEFTSNGNVPDLFYRLNTLVDLASDQGVIAHLYFIVQIYIKYSNSYLFPGLNLVMLEGDKKEVDIFGTMNGKVIAGEVKSRNSYFTRGQIERDVQLSRRLGADLHVMYALDGLKASQVNYARMLCKKFGVVLFEEIA